MESEAQSVNINDKFCKLYVGDRLFVASEATLLNHQDSYFATLLSERYEEHKNKNDIIYIDRDGTHFNAILNHLRGCLKLDHWSTKDLQELAIEADYYVLIELTNKIDSIVANRIVNKHDIYNDHLKIPFIHLDFESLKPILETDAKLTYIIFIDRKGSFTQFLPLLRHLEEKRKSHRLTELFDIACVYDEKSDEQKEKDQVRRTEPSHHLPVRTFELQPHRDHRTIHRLKMYDPKQQMIKPIYEWDASIYMEEAYKLICVSLVEYFLADKI